MFEFKNKTVTIFSIIASYFIVLYVYNITVLIHHVLVDVCLIRNRYALIICVNRNIIETSHKFDVLCIGIRSRIRYRGIICTAI